MKYDEEAITAVRNKDWAELNRIMERLPLSELRELAWVAEELQRRTWGMFLYRQDVGEPVK